MALLKDGTRIYGTANVDTGINVGANVVANTTTVRIGNTTFYANLRSTVVSVVGGSNGSYVNASMVLVSTTTGTSYYMGSGANLTSSGTLNIGTANATANGFKANNNNVSVGNSTVNVTVTTAGITSSGGTGVNPSSNSLGVTLGTSTQRWVVSANTIDASGLITAAAGANIQGTANLVDVNISGNLTVSGTTTYINTTNLNVGDNIVTLNADLTGATAPTENAGLEVNRGSSANVSFLWNETSDSWTLGNTDITGYANASVSVNSALLTVGTDFIANTQGAYHTGTVNAASHTTSGITANTSGIYPSSNTVGTALGSTTNRWILVANTGSFAGAVSGITTLAAGNTTVTGFVNASASVNSALLTVGTSFIANTTQVTIAAGVPLSANGTTGTAGQLLYSNGTVGSPYWNSPVGSRTSTTASAATITPDANSFDQYNLTAQAAGLTINAPTGTPIDGQKLLFRILDNGTTRAITWNATYTVIGTTLPTATTASKMTYVGCIYNSTNLRWDVVAVTTEI